ncbi:MAG TPA: carbohydrate ABC transporter permease [Capillibacterium sp.]
MKPGQSHQLLLPREQPGKGADLKKIGIKICLYLPLLLWTVITVYPFWYMMVLSTRSLSEIFAFPPPMWFGRALAENYRILMERLPFWRNVWNSVYIAVMATVTTLFFCSLGGYGFAVYEFKGKKVLFNMMLATLMIPALLGIIPFFIMMRFFGWINTPRALYLPGAASAYGIYLLRQYITGAVPLALIDAARIDGCSEFGIYRRIVLPIIKPGLAALGIITFLGSWDNFMSALVILREKMTYTIPVALRSFQGQAQTDYGAIMVGASIAVLPLVIVFLFMSRQLIAGLTYGAVKG